MTDSRPRLPEVPALANDDSMLTRRFGKEVVNYYAGGRLNRYSFLRPDVAFLRRAAAASDARYIALSKLNPVVQDQSSLALFTLEDVKPLIGAEPFSLSESEAEAQFDSSAPAALLVFLGMLDDGASTTEVESTDHGTIKGQPHFAVDISSPRLPSSAVGSFNQMVQDKGLSEQTNTRGMTLAPEAGKPTITPVPNLANKPQPPCSPRPAP